MARESRDPPSSPMCDLKLTPRGGGRLPGVGDRRGDHAEVIDQRRYRVFAPVVVALAQARRYRALAGAYPFQSLLR
jgi:hypothetical protein